MEHKGTVRLETERLILRRFTMDDLEPIFCNCWSDHDVWKWTNYKPMHSIEEVVTVAEMFTPKWLGWYDRPNRYSWAIEEKSSGQVIGRMFGMFPDDELCQVELAYELGQAWWNRGYMTEAVQAILQFFFCEVEFKRVVAYHAGENPTSGRVMQKCGMQFESIIENGCKCNNGVFDKVNYAITKEEYSKQMK